MSLYSRRWVLIAGLALAGCGFTPVYGPSGVAAGLKGSVAVETPTNKDDFDLVKQLELRLGVADVAKYRLSYSLSVSRDGVGVTPAQEIIRYNLVGKVNFSLLDQNGVTVTSGSVNNFTSYSVDPVNVTSDPPSTNSTMSTLAARRDARTRLMVILADQIVTRLAVTAADWNR